ncbi:protein trichome birefringence-like 34 [Canna indica]|uniref:Protein trichome birefringence-like 34 n=1 Tax=Canna indica TaxID=4628 RepID=A0AAQ3JVJ0_9LILI|nr:protein trichome birefringence-like 34 [Canna indica]
MAKIKNAVVFSLPEHYFSWGTTNASSLLPFLFALFFVVLLVISLSYDKVDYLLLPAATLFDVHQPAVSAPVLLSAETTTTTSVDDDQYCDLFSGRWVLDNVTRPLYSGRRCTYMHDEVACEKYGRTDLKHQLWRWQPHACNIPRFDAERMLRKLSGKRMVYVGDSLNRNQWVSMVCMLESALSTDTKSMTFDGSLMSFKAKEFNASIDFYWSPLLVESNCDDPVHHRLSDRIMRANSIQTHAKQWADADILVFNSYLWWKKPGMKMKVLYGSFEDEKQNLEEFEMVEGFEMALKEWSNWLESNRNLNAQVFFVSLSPTHVWGDEWGAASTQNCYNETEPIHKEGYASRGSDYKMMHIVEDTVAQLSQKGVHVQILNITQLSEYRKDGHPSIYRRYWVNLTDQELAKPNSYADCTHWCVPGVPDAWNELLYTYIISQQK